MKIILVSTATGGGGAQKAAVNLASYFAEVGHAVTYFHWAAPDAQTYELHPDVLIVRSPGAGLLSRLAALALLIRRVRPAAVFGFTDVPNVLAFFASRLGAVKCKVILGVHSNLLQRDSQIREGQVEKALRGLHKVACRNASAVIAVSDEARQSLIDYYRLPNQLVHRIYNPVIRRVGTAIERSKGSGYDLVAVGRLTAAKDYPLMIQALAELVHRRRLPARLTIFGEGEERASLERLVLELGLEERVTFVGFCPDVQSRLREFDLFLLTSRWEGFGIVLVEALNAGLNVVSTNCPSGPAEILAGGRFGTLVDDVSPEGVADAVEAALAAPRTWDSSELATHLESFSISKIGEEYLRLARC